MGVRLVGLKRGGCSRDVDFLRLGTDLQLNINTGNGIDRRRDVRRRYRPESLGCDTNFVSARNYVANGVTTGSVGCYFTPVARLGVHRLALSLRDNCARLVRDGSNDGPV